MSHRKVNWESTESFPYVQDDFLYWAKALQVCKKWLVAKFRKTHAKIEHDKQYKKSFSQSSGKILITEAVLVSLNH